ncbi:hypothetical protein ANN_23861 [Periplaneta americana]|uniref:Uncharacterized protein n=1 Tax=Periplaneta americana TaxID=6978 RepID=A0ABQ8S266_PERAM|nr:hypothetical protein ANN_23861 [Periplaneta americana]
MERLGAALTFMQRYHDDGDEFLYRIVTGDETWISHFTPETKQQSMHWRYSGSPVRTKFKQTLSVRKVMCTVFWNRKGILLFDFFPRGETVNADRYCETLRKLRRAIQNKRRGMLTAGVVLLHDNARPHTARRTAAVLTEFGWELFDHPPYSPDLAPSDFHVFLHLKKFLSSSERFGNDEELKTSVTRWFHSQAAEFYDRGIQRRTMWKNKFEMTYVGPSQVLVKPLAPGSRGVILKSHYGYEIDDVRIMGRDNYLVARTSETILLGDLQRNLLSEVLWTNSGRNEKFYFDNPTVCLIFNAGELSLVEYGENDILGSVRTEFMNPHQISVRLNERRQNNAEDNKKLAYLLDLKTICIVDLVYGATISQVTHDSKIDWLELNETGHKLLFRDKKMRLTLLDIARDQKNSILNFCTFVQWVPGSDVVVAQSRNNLCVWYNIDVPEQVTLFNIKGEIVDVVRADGKTEYQSAEVHHEKKSIYEPTVNLKQSFRAKMPWSTGADVTRRFVYFYSRHLQWLGILGRSLLQLLQVSRAEDFDRGYLTTEDVCCRSRRNVIVQEGHHQLGYELDEGLVEFGTAIHDNDFGRAVMFLESLGDKPEAEAMWSNLADIAISTNRLQVAERCYAALGDVARTHYLRETIKIADEYAKTNDGNGLACPEVWARLAILNKSLKDAEAIYLEQNQLDEALSMYQSFHKWDEALALAELKGHPKYEELREKHMKWLVESKQEERAGELKEKDGDYDTALSLYLRASLPTRASRLIQNNPDMLQNDELVAKVASALLRSELFEQAGELYEKVNQTEKAFDCYRKSKAFPRAIELARYVSPSEVVHLEEQWGDHLVANKQLDAAISHYIEAGKTMKALEAAVGARQWKKAVQIIQVFDDPKLVTKYYAQLGQHFASNQEYHTAENLYIKAEMYKEAINMYNQAGEWEKAYSLASQYLEPDEVSAMYISQAKALEEEGKLREAEKLYLYISEPDMAISMYKKHHQYDQMMRLVSQYHNELVQTTHLHLAQQMEAENNWRGAEQHYLHAGDWKGAVNMYRATSMWEDAFRVAKTNGGSQASQQVAFLWAKSLGGDSAVKLLNKFNLLEISIDYACEIYQFEFAFDLARTAMKSKMPDIHYKYAMALEDDGKFEDAEKEFVKAGKPKEAVLMYIHNQDWDSAQRVAEEQDPDSVTEVLLGQAKDVFNSKNYSHFESLMLRAQKPDLIIKHYQDAGMWVDALRVCREYLPSRLPALQAEYEREVGSKGSKDVASLIAQAKEWEQSGEYKTAVDCLLKVNPSLTKDQNIIIKAWTQAAELITKYPEGQQAIEIANILGPRLVSIQQHNLAAQVYLGVDMIKEAIDTFIQAEEWNKAKRVAKELEPTYEDYVDNRYKDWLKRQGRADQLADVDIIGALDLLAEQGQWVKCLETAKQHGPQVLHKYVALYATQLIKDGYPLEALALYTKYDAPLYPQNYNIYKRIAMDMFNMPALDTPDAYSSWAQLRNILFSLTEAMKTSSDAGSSLHDEFDNLLVISHYYAARAAGREVKSLDHLVAKLSTSLLRHTDIIPADKAFYEAGIDCKAVGQESEAFVFLNHYLDLCEAIEEGNPDLLDYTDFTNTDFPMEIPLPASLHLSPQQHEEVKEWVLAVSMDQRVDQTLPLDERGLTPSALTSPGRSGPPATPCVVSGFPVLSQRGRNPIEFKRPGKQANRDDWNKLMMAAKMAPETHITDAISFIEEWCGGAPGFSFQ